MIDSWQIQAHKQAVMFAMLRLSRSVEQAHQVPLQQSLGKCPCALMTKSCCALEVLLVSVLAHVCGNMLMPLSPCALPLLGPHASSA